MSYLIGQHLWKEVAAWMQILDEIVPDLTVRREEEEKRQRVSQRLQRQMGNVLLDPEGGFGR